MSKLFNLNADNAVAAANRQQSLRELLPVGPAHVQVTKVTYNTSPNKGTNSFHLQCHVVALLNNDGSQRMNFKTGRPLYQNANVWDDLWITDASLIRFVECAKAYDTELTIEEIVKTLNGFTTAPAAVKWVRTWLNAEKVVRVYVGQDRKNAKNTVRW
jgi:hypothetical protein